MSADAAAHPILRRRCACVSATIRTHLVISRHWTFECHSRNQKKRTGPLGNQEISRWAPAVSWKSGPHDRQAVPLRYAKWFYLAHL